MVMAKESLDRSYLARTGTTSKSKADNRHGPHMAAKSEIAVTYIQIILYYSTLVQQMFHRASTMSQVWLLRSWGAVMSSHARHRRHECNKNPGTKRWGMMELGIPWRCWDYRVVEKYLWILSSFFFFRVNARTFLPSSFNAKTITGRKGDI